MIVRMSLVTGLMVLFVGLPGPNGVDARQHGDASNAGNAAKQAVDGETPIVWMSEEYDSQIDWLQPGSSDDMFALEGSTLRRYSLQVREETLEIAGCSGATAVQAVTPQEEGPEVFVVGFSDGSVKLFGSDEDNGEVSERASLRVFNREVFGLMKFGRRRDDAVLVAVAADRESVVKVVEVTSSGISESAITLEHSRPVTAVVSAGIPVTGDQTGTVRGWNEQGEEQWSVQAHRGAVGMMAGSNNRVVTLGARDNTLKKVDRFTGRERGEVRVRRGVTSVSIDSRYVAVAYQEGTVEQWLQSEIRAGSRNPEQRLRVGSGRLLGAYQVYSRVMGVAFERESVVRMVRLEPLAEIPQIPGRGELPQYLYPMQNSSSDLWGYIDGSGRLVIDYMFTRAWFPNEHGYFQVGVPGRRGTCVFNRNREWVVTPPRAEFLSNTVIGPNHLQVYNRLNETRRLTDLEGNELAPEIEFERLREFRDGRAAFRLDDKWGAIDLDGNVVVEPTYDVLGNFVDGHAVAHLHGESTTLIDRDGDTVVDFGITRLHFYGSAISEGRISLFDLVERENRVYDFEGNVLITRETQRHEMNYTGIIDFSHGYGRLLLEDGSYHIVDVTGEIVSGPYGSVGPFIEGFAVVRTRGGAHGILDHNLNWIFEGAAHRISTYPGPMFAFYGRSGNLTHYMNPAGDIFRRPE